MKPEDVTSEMERVYFGEVYSKRERTLKEEIAAAFNAVISDAEPITAERLLRIGYVKGLHDPETYCKIAGDRTISVCNRGNVYLDFGLLHNTKTIGQLLALHAGLGIGEVQP